MRLYALFECSWPTGWSVGSDMRTDVSGGNKTRMGKRRWRLNMRSHIRPRTARGRVCCVHENSFVLPFCAFGFSPRCFPLASRGVVTPAFSSRVIWDAYVLRVTYLRRPFCGHGHAARADARTACGVLFGVFAAICATSCPGVTVFLCPPLELHWRIAICGCVCRERRPRTRQPAAAMNDGSHSCHRR